MTSFTTERWLLVAIAVVGLALAIPVVSAHGSGPLAGDAPVDNASMTDRTGWMGPNAGDHTTPASLEGMAQQMGMTVRELGKHRADGDHSRDHGQVQHRDHQHRDRQHQDHQHQDHQHRGQHGRMTGLGSGC